MDSLLHFFGYFSPGNTPSLEEKQDGESTRNGKRTEGNGEYSTRFNKAELVAKRKQMIGSKCQTFFSADPFIVSRASMQFLFDESGNQYLDCISNVQHVGHCHSRVVEAIHAQLLRSTCNIRFLSPVLTDCAESLLGTFPPELDTVLFCNSGSEANDLAMQLARDWSKAKDIIVQEHAYHGHISTTVEMSPYKFNRGANIKQPDWVHVVPVPDVYRGKYRLANDELTDNQKRHQLGQRYAEYVKNILEENKRRGRRVAGFIAEALQSCGGQVNPPEGYFRSVSEEIRAHGGVMIVDEVQTGFGRVGEFWAYQLNGEGFVPDIVTMGKSMGNGFPVAAVVTRKEIADKHCGGVEYFNTYGGNPVSCAAALAVMNAIKDDHLLEHSRKMGKLFETALNELKERHECVGDVRGAGMFWGVDLVENRQSREPATDLAAKLILRLRQKSNVLLNSDGPYNNILKFKPPLCFGETDLKEAVNAIDEALDELTSIVNLN